MVKINLPRSGLVQPLFAADREQRCGFGTLAGSNEVWEKRQFTEAAAETCR